MDIFHIFKSCGIHSRPGTQRSRPVKMPVCDIFELNRDQKNILLGEMVPGTFVR